MSIEERIKFYEEVLKEDPSSKLFFPLARLYIEQKELQKSIRVLRSGLEKHPDHMEARLMLIELLLKKGEERSSEEVDDHIRRLEKIFKSYPSFWERWADLLAQDGDKEIAGLVGLLGLKFALGEIDSLGYLIYQGIKGIGKKGGPPSPREEPKDMEKYPSNKKDINIKKVDDTSEKSTCTVDFKTKTMADILFSQGNYEEALDIYEELYKKVNDDAEKTELKECIFKTKERLQGKDKEKKDTLHHKKDKKKLLLSKLSLLAQRLESRARAVM